MNQHRERRKGRSKCGRKPENDLRHLQGILWIMRCAAPWRDLPERFGKWKSVYSAFRRFIENGLFEAVLAALQRIGADLEMVMVDSSGCRAHQDASGPEGGQQAQAMGRSKGGLSTKIHMACDALGYPLGFHLTAANESDYGN
ncbi:IS5 family transposase [Pelagicoccus enzymogenes]|uniref:IS5 family transposase n=1 Tax=Pelagicoccus enzymogenes TaxID=2773457 RepID=UPI00280E7DD1|nr:IS5 family transposase [Pelagicoccus enzymogenes]MDQ8199392.1 IS5 family transposase [Pelagicoccus enzymogenes]